MVAFSHSTMMPISGDLAVFWPLLSSENWPNLFDRAVHLAVGGEAVDFGDEGGVGVVMDRDEGVRGLGAVDVAEAAADGDDLSGDFVRVQEPAGDVDLVDRLVAKVAAAVVPEPVPIIMDRALVGRLR